MADTVVAFRLQVPPRLQTYPLVQRLAGEVPRSATTVVIDYHEARFVSPWCVDALADLVSRRGRKVTSHDVPSRPTPQRRNRRPRQ